MTNHGKHPHSLEGWDSEVFLLSASSRQELLYELEDLAMVAQREPQIALKDIAYNCNCVRTRNAPAEVASFRLGLVVKSHDDLLAKISRASELITSGSNRVSDSQTGIYFAEESARTQGKLAYVFPGLGSAYANMLRELCLNFPEIRYVFDFVDDVATKAGALKVPSELIYSERAGLNAAALASTESAVIAVLMAEHALYEFLKRVGINPDVLMGCSTGEFAVYTLNGCIDVIKAADLFYSLSLRVARSIPTESLSSLRSVRAFAHAEKVMPIVRARTSEVFLGADLGPDYVILTGRADAVEAAVTELRKHSVLCHQLPVAIPYHTPLVEDVVTTEETKSLEIHPLQVPSWSCATAQPSPSLPDEVRQFTTDLFSRPVLFRKTIEAMYEDGVRIFVEVGPNGLMTSLTSDILADKEHIAVASNLASRSAITQINHLLAVLSVNDVPLDLNYLYVHRDPVEFTERSAGVPPAFTSERSAGVPPAFDQTDSVIQGFLRTNAQFYDRVLQAQTSVMTEYLERSAGVSPAFDLPFLRNALVETSGETTTITTTFDPSTHLYLHDHVIGGNVGTFPVTCASLVPLMVVLEVMAESCRLHCPELVPVRLEHVKAYRRISVRNTSVPVRINVSGTDDRLKVQMFLCQDDKLLVECDVLMSADWVESPPANISCDGCSAPQMVTAENLYHPKVMFHGSSMQAILNVDGVKDRFLTAVASPHSAEGWFEDGDGPLTIHPLLLDNATQLTLYYLREAQIDTSALLPFYIEALELYDLLHSEDEPIRISAQMHAASERGTEATLELINAEGRLLARFNRLCSRRIGLSDTVQDFVHDSTATFISRELTEISVSNSVIRIVTGESLPEDDSTLDWLTDYVLTDREKETWSSLSDLQRRREWLAGRIAAKDAVRRLIQESQLENTMIGCVDLEIVSRDGRPFVVLPDALELLDTPLISISHSEDVAVAVATFSSRSPGIDFQKIKSVEGGFAELVFTSEEAQFIRKSPDVNTESIRLWSAKEAALKAIGAGSIREFQTDLSRFSPSKLLLLRNGKEVAIDTVPILNGILSLAT